MLGAVPDEVVQDVLGANQQVLDGEFGGGWWLEVQVEEPVVGVLGIDVDPAVTVQGGVVAVDRDREPGGEARRHDPRIVGSRERQGNRVFGAPESRRLGPAVEQVGRGFEVAGVLEARRVDQADG